MKTIFLTFCVLAIANLSSAQPMNHSLTGRQIPPFGRGPASPTDLVQLTANLDTAKGRGRVDLLNQLTPLTDSLELARTYGQAALQLAQLLNYADGMAVAHTQLGDATLWQRHTIGPADSLIGIAATYKTSEADLLRWNDLLGNALFIGQSLWLRSGPQQTAEALAHYQKALAVRQTQGSADGEVWAWHKLGDFYFQSQELALAEAQYVQWLKVREREGNPQKIAWARRFLIDFYLATGQLAQAGAAHRASLLARQKDTPAGYVAVLRNAAAFFGANQRLEESEKYLLEAYAVAETNRLATYLPGLSRSLFDLYARQWAQASTLSVQADWMTKLKAWEKPAGGDLGTMLLKYAQDQKQSREEALYYVFLALGHRIALQDSIKIGYVMPVFRTAKIQLTNPDRQVNPSAKTYVVQPGENLYGIATRLGIKISSLKDWNKLTTSELDLTTGQLLLIAPPDRPSDPMAVRSSRISTAALADTLAKFAQQKEPTLTKEVAYELWLTAAQLHAQAGEPAKANLELGQVLKKFPCKTCLLPDEITNLMADNELAARRFPQALKIYQENLRLYLDKEKWRLVLPQYGRIGRLYTAWSKTDEAEQTYLGVEQTCRKRNFVLPPEQAFALAQLYEKKGQNEKAIAYANKTLKAMNLFAQDLTRPELLPSPATEAVALLRRLVQPIGAMDTENAEFVIHTTGETETLESIGKLYDVSVECLYDWNFVPSPVLAKGSRVKVCRRADWQRVDDPEHPLPGNQPVVYKVKEGQTLTMVARIHKVELAQLHQWNRETAATPDYLQPNTEVIVGWVFKQCSCGK